MAFPRYPIPLRPFVAVGFVATDVAGEGQIGLLQNSTSSPYCLIQVVPPHPYFTVSQIRARIVGDQNGVNAHSAIPANRPKVQLYRQQTPAAAPVFVAEAADTSATANQYDGAHSITLDLGGGAFVVPESESIWIRFVGESGSNSIADSVCLTSLLVLGGTDSPQFLASAW